MYINPNDPLVTFEEAALRMGVNRRSARRILRKEVHPVHTPWGVRYRLDDVAALRRTSR